MLPAAILSKFEKRTGATTKDKNTLLPIKTLIIKSITKATYLFNNF